MSMPHLLTKETKTKKDNHNKIIKATNRVNSEASHTAHTEAVGAVEATREIQVTTEIKTEEEANPDQGLTGQEAAHNLNQAQNHAIGVVKTTMTRQIAGSKTNHA